MLTLHSVSKHFNTTLAVDSVSFSIQPGEIFALIGPNGSGKTTIIKMIAGLLKPTSGEIIVDEKEVTSYPRDTKAVTGYIPDEPTIWPAMTGEEFLHFSGALYNLEESFRVERIAQLLKLFNLHGIAHNYFEDYSRGNKQKFVILAALLHQPKLLLIDEPIVGLDPTSAEIARDLFKDFVSQGKCILLATHTLSVAEQIAHKIGVLKNGVLAEVGTFDELKAKAQLDTSASLEDVYRSLTA